MIIRKIHQIKQKILYEIDAVKKIKEKLFIQMKTNEFFKNNKSIGIGALTKNKQNF